MTRTIHDKTLLGCYRFGHETYHFQHFFSGRHIPYDKNKGDNQYADISVKAKMLICRHSNECAYRAETLHRDWYAVVGVTFW